MIKLSVDYHAVVDGKDQLIKGIHNLPETIEKDLVDRGFAETIEEKKLTGEEKEVVKTFYLVDGNLTETEPKAEEPKETIYTRESIADLKVPELEALAKLKEIELKGKDKAEKVEEICVALGL